MPEVAISASNFYSLGEKRILFNMQTSEFSNLLWPSRRKILVHAMVIQRKLYSEVKVHDSYYLCQYAKVSTVLFHSWQ